MLVFLNNVLLFPWFIGKYIFSLGMYWFLIGYLFNTDAFIAFTEYLEERWNYWVKKMQNRRK